MATIITLLVVPVYKDGRVVRHKAKVTIGHIQCERGKRIPPSAKAKRLGVAGKICRRIIPRVVQAEDSVRSKRVGSKARVRR